jgi:hypothetical protein
LNIGISRRSESVLVTSVAFCNRRPRLDFRYALRIVRASNGAHILGTLVPVEEPSTASEADVQSRLFDDLVGSGEQ